MRIAQSDPAFARNAVYTAKAETYVDGPAGDQAATQVQPELP